MTDRDFMLRAIALAEQAARCAEVPVGAVIVKDGKIIGEGRNRREEKKNALCHAEIEAIDNACRAIGSRRLTGCDMYVTLEPCAMCAGAAINARVGSIIFGAYDERCGCCGSRENLFSLIPDGCARIVGGYMQSECSRLLSEFFSALRK